MKIKETILACTITLLSVSYANAQATSASNTLTGTQYLGSSNNFPVLFKANNTEYARLATNGYVGIGTNNPLQKLHVNNGAIFINGTSPMGGPMLVLGDGPGSPNNGQWGIEYVPTGSGNPGLNFFRPWPASNFGNFFLFLADNTGNIGIKTDNPTASLTVNGNALIGDPSNVTLPAGYKLYVESGILTEKVKVAVKNTANWSDYVFAKDYKLNKLEDVELFVRKNFHLPNVPSAEEVVKDGIDMATMDAKLLEKIEEMTLYIIDLNKQLQELKAQVSGSKK